MELTLSDAMTNAVKWFFANLHTAAPGFIQSFNSDKQSAIVKSSIKRTLTDGSVQELPIIANVPVITLKTGTAGLHVPVNAGDGVLLVFCERALERWLSSEQGKIVEAGDVRKYNFTDAVAIIGLNPLTFNYPYKDNSIYLYHNNGRIKIDESNKIAIGNDSTELLDILSRTLTGIAAITVSGVPIDNLATFTALKTELDLLKGSL